MSIAAAITQLGEVLRGVTDADGRPLRVFTAAETGANGIPEAINQFPAAIVFPGQTTGYRLVQQEEGHEYEVHVQLLESAGFLAERTASALPLLELVLDAMSDAIGLVNGEGQRLVTMITFQRQSGLVELVYSRGPDFEMHYAGYDCTFKVVSRRSITPSLGG